MRQRSELDFERKNAAAQKCVKTLTLWITGFYWISIASTCRSYLIMRSSAQKAIAIRCVIYRAVLQMPQSREILKIDFLVQASSVFPFSRPNREAIARTEGFTKFRCLDRHNDSEIA